MAPRLKSGSCLVVGIRMDICNMQEPSFQSWEGEERVWARQKVFEGEKAHVAFCLSWHFVAQNNLIEEMIHLGASAQLMISLLLSWRQREPTWKDLRGVENALRLRAEAEALRMRRPAARRMKRSAGRVWTVAWVIRQPMNTPGWDRRWMYIIFTLERQRQTCNRKDRKTSYQLPGTDPELYWKAC